MKESKQKISKSDARQGETGHGVRYVLLVSVTLTIVAFAIIFALFA